MKLFPTYGDKKQLCMSLVEQLAKLAIYYAKKKMYDTEKVITDKITIIQTKYEKGEDIIKIIQDVLLTNTFDDHLKNLFKDLLKKEINKISSGLSSGISSGLSSGVSSGVSSGLSSGVSSGVSSGISVSNLSAESLSKITMLGGYFTSYTKTGIQLLQLPDFGFGLDDIQFNGIFNDMYDSYNNIEFSDPSGHITTLYNITLAEAKLYATVMGSKIYAFAYVSEETEMARGKKQDKIYNSSAYFYNRTNSNFKVVAIKKSNAVVYKKKERVDPEALNKLLDKIIGKIENNQNPNEDFIINIDNIFNILHKMALHCNMDTIKDVDRFDYSNMKKEYEGDLRFVLKSYPRGYNYIPFTTKFNKIKDYLIGFDEEFKVKDIVVNKFIFIAMIDMLYETQDIFDKYNIKNWWLLGGTMIGAARNKGPPIWDDDIDLGILGYKMTDSITISGKLYNYGDVVGDFYKLSKEELDTKYSLKDIKDIWNFPSELQFLYLKFEFIKKGYDIGGIYFKDMPSGWVAGDGWWTLNYTRRKFRDVLMKSLPFVDFNSVLVQSEEYILSNMETYLEYYFNSNSPGATIPHLDLFTYFKEKNNYVGIRTSDWKIQYYERGLTTILEKNGYVNLNLNSSKKKELLDFLNSFDISGKKIDQLHFDEFINNLINTLGNKDIKTKFKNYFDDGTFVDYNFRNDLYLYIINELTKKGIAIDYSKFHFFKDSDMFPIQKIAFLDRQINCVKEVKEIIKSAYGDKALTVGRIWGHAGFSSEMTVDFNKRHIMEMHDNYYNSISYYSFYSDPTITQIGFIDCSASTTYDENTITTNLIANSSSVILAKGIRVNDLLLEIYKNKSSVIYPEKVEIQNSKLILGFKVVDITNQLSGSICINNIPSPQGKAIHKFNNAIVPTGKPNEYKMLYRAFWKGNYDTASNDIKNINSLWNRNPLVNDTDWNFIFNTLGQCDLTIDDAFNVSVSNDKICEKYVALEDPRIFKDSKGKVHVTTQGQVWSNFYGVNGPNNCKENICVTLSKHIYDIENNKLITDLEILCPDKSQNIEKNWMMYEYENNLYFYYDLNNQKTIKYGEHECELISLNPNRLDDIHKKSGIMFSGGTPAIPFNKDGRDLRIACGHAKANNNYIKSHIDQTKISNFDNYFQHFQLTYWMFFVTFDPKTAEVVHISDLFIPTSPDIHNSHMPYLLVFPMSLIEINNEYIISYGEGDVKCKLMKIPINDAVSMLKPLNNINSADDLVFSFISEAPIQNVIAGGSLKEKRYTYKNRL